MWIGNPPESTAQPVRSGLRSTGQADADVIILPPAWRVDVVPHPTRNEYSEWVSPSFQPMIPAVESSPNGAIQRIHWTLAQEPPSPDLFPSRYFNVPTDGRFELSLGGRSVGALNYDASNDEIDRYVEAVALSAGITSVRCQSWRDDHAGIFIRMENSNDPSFRFPRFELVSGVTGGGILYPEEVGGFVMFRRLNYWETPMMFQPEDHVEPPFPYEDYIDTPAYDSLIEWHRSPFVRNDFSNEKIWYRSERRAGLRFVDWGTAFLPQYWQLGYQLVTRHNPSFGTNVYSSGWILMLHTERQHHGGDHASGVGWPIPDDEAKKLIANHPVRCGPMTYFQSAAEQLGQSPIDDSRNAELPRYIWITPDWG
ncbi:MAG TPA: hypothetical protein VNQ76_18295 [Planctomicrobium sp.]|nr:hypothetical protein [Planctomicrobium sp.]